MECCKSSFFFFLPGYILTVYSQSYPFGWEPESDGFRGHVFATPDNSTVIISIKGTSAGVFGGGGPTTKKDKLNDNLLFSCCCARVDWTWTTVCGCYRGGWKCDQTCLQDALASESLFYPIGTVCYIFFLNLLLVSVINIIRFLVFVQQPYLHVVSTSLRWLSNAVNTYTFLSALILTYGWWGIHWVVPWPVLSVLHLVYQQ